MFVVMKAVAALLFVTMLLYSVLKLLQKYTKIGGHSSNAGGIKLDGLMYIDDSTKIVNLTHGAMGYLLLVSKNGNLLLDKYEKQ